MLLYCLKNENITPAVEYTLNHILDQLGYFYEWVDSAENIDENTPLLCYSSPEDPQPAGRKNTIIIPDLINPAEIDVQKIRWQERQIGEHLVPVFGLKKPADDKNSTYFCDLTANIFFHLARLDEQHITHPDQMIEHEEKSILFKHGQYKVPAVDILINDFGKFIENSIQPPAMLIRKAAWPGNEQFGLAVTHDVDMITAFHRPKKIILKILSRLGLYKKHTPAEMDEADRNIWGFDKLLAFYQQKKFKASFFFMARFREGRHFRYRIQRPKIKRILVQLKSDGHEIGLHPSRFVFEYPNRYRQEKSRLEKYAQQKVSGMRHHYLRGLFPQLWQKAAELGLQYDAAMIHRHHSGFRSGSCRPFSVFDAQQNKPLPVIEFPTSFFENTLPEEGRNIEASLNVIKQLLAVTKKHSGLFTILWHTNNLYYNDPYPLLWQKIWQLLEDETYFAGTLKDHLKWFKQRNEISLKINENDLFFAVPQDLNEFSLIFPHENFKFDCPDKNIKLSFEKKCLRIKTARSTNSFKIKLSPQKTQTALKKD